MRASHNPGSAAIHRRFGLAAEPPESDATTTDAAARTGHPNGNELPHSKLMECGDSSPLWIAAEPPWERRHDDRRFRANWPSKAEMNYRSGVRSCARHAMLVGVRQTSGVRGVVNPGRNRRKAATRKTDTLYELELRRPAPRNMHSIHPRDTWLPSTVRIPSTCLLFVALLTATGAAKIDISQIEVGIDGTYKLGKWTNIHVTIDSDTATTGKLEIATTDGEGVACHYVIDALAVTAGSTRVTRQIRLGQNRELKVRLVLPSGESAELVHVVARDPITAWQQWVLTIGSDIEIEKSLRLRRRPANEALIGTYARDCAKLPEHWLGYDGVDVIFLTTGDAGWQDRVSDEQFAAIRAWVAKGGRLVICAAANVRPLMGQGGPLAALAPGPLKQVMRQRQTAGLETYADTSQRLDVLMQDAAGRIEGLRTAVFEIQEGVVDVEEGFGRERSAWIIRRPFGFGIVTLLAADIDAQPISNWVPRHKLIARLLDDALPGRYDEIEETQSGQMTHVGYRDLSGQMRSAMEQFSGVRLVPFSLIAGMAVVYILLIGPVDYFVLRRLWRRMSLTWLTFPLIVAATCLLAGWLAQRWKGDEVRVNEVHLVDIDGRAGEYRGTTWTHIYTPRTQELSVSLWPQPERLVPSAVEQGTALAWQGLPGNGFGGMSAASRHGAFLRPYEIYLEQAGVSAGLRQLSMPKWASRSLSGVSYGKCTAPLEMGVIAVNRDGLLQGEIKNSLTVPIRDAAICFGRWYYRIGELEPDETFRLESGTPKDLRTHLTKRTFLSSDATRMQRRDPESWRRLGIRRARTWRPSCKWLCFMTRPAAARDIRNCCTDLKAAWI